MGYENGKIYKIVGSGLTYYGSTIDKLCNRKSNHKNQIKNQNQTLCSSKDIIDKGNWEMILVELFPCENKEQLFWRERWWIENNICINKQRPITTEEEKKKDIKDYHLEHKEYLKEYFKDYYIAHKEELNVKSKDYRLANKDIISVQRKEYRLENKDIISVQKKEYRLANKDKISKQRRERYLAKKLLSINML